MCVCVLDHPRHVCVHSADFSFFHIRCYKTVWQRPINNGNNSKSSTRVAGVHRVAAETAASTCTRSALVLSAYVRPSRVVAMTSGVKVPLRS